MTDSEAALPLLSRYAIMVDVGYIYASAGELLFSASSRREYRVDADKLIAALIKQADDQVRGQLLRVYWYDAARDRVPTFDQRVIAQMPLVKLRLGNLNARGQQKGVDAQIRADMEALARHRAITDAILVAGDEDMVPAVEAAQAFGVRVHLWGVEPPYGTNQAERLVWESDTVEVLERALHRAVLRPAADRRGGARRRPRDAAAQAGPGRDGARDLGRPDHRAVARSALRRQEPVPLPRQAELGPPELRPPGRGQARPVQGAGRGGRRARGPEVDTDPRRGQHPRPAARPDPAAGDRQGTSGRRREGARASRCAPTRRRGSGCGTRSGPGCTGSSASASASRGTDRPGSRWKILMPNKAKLPPPGAQADPDGGALARPPGGLAGRPVLSVVRGQPTEAELAAVVAVLAVRAAAAAALASMPPTSRCEPFCLVRQIAAAARADRARPRRLARQRPSALALGPPAPRTGG